MLAADRDRRQRARQAPIGVGGRRLHRVGVGRRVADEHPHQPAPAELGLAGRRRLLQRIALRRLGGEHVDIGEDRLREQIQGLGLQPGRDPGGGKPPPGDARADPVGAQQRLQAASGTHLAASERPVDIGAPHRTAGVYLGHEMAQGLLHPRAQPVAERPLQGAGIRRNGGDRLDHLAGDVRELRAQHLGNLRRELMPRLVGHRFISSA